MNIDVHTKKIISYLNFRDLIGARRTNKKWFALTEQPIRSLMTKIPWNVNLEYSRDTTPSLNVEKAWVNIWFKKDPIAISSRSCRKRSRDLFCHSSNTESRRYNISFDGIGGDVVSLLLRDLPTTKLVVKHNFETPLSFRVVPYESKPKLKFNEIPIVCDIFLK